MANQKYMSKTLLKSRLWAMKHCGEGERQVEEIHILSLGLMYGLLQRDVAFFVSIAQVAQDLNLATFFNSHLKDWLIQEFSFPATEIWKCSLNAVMFQNRGITIPEGFLQALYCCCRKVGVVNFKMLKEYEDFENQNMWEYQLLIKTLENHQDNESVKSNQSNLKNISKTNESDIPNQFNLQNISKTQQSIKSQLVNAVNENNPQTIKDLVKKGGDPNMDYKGNPLLHIAAAAGFVDATRALLLSGANREKLNMDRQMAIEVAIENFQEEIVKLLWKPHVYNRRILFERAVREKNMSLLNILLNQCEHSKELDETGNSELHLAVSIGSQGSIENIRIIEMVLKKCDIPNFKNIYGKAPIHIAANNNDYQALKLLCKYVDVNVQDDDGKTALHYVANKGYEKCLDYLLDANAVVDIPDNVKYTALCYAARNKHDRIIKRLINEGANVQHSTKDGNTPLHIYVENGGSTCLEVLSTSVDLDTITGNGRNPLHVASIRGNLEAVEALLSLHADINATDSRGLKPIHLAAVYGKLEVVKLLASHGADVEDTIPGVPSLKSLVKTAGHYDVLEYLNSLTNINRISINLLKGE